MTTDPRVQRAHMEQAARDQDAADHRSYWHPVLEAAYCEADGEPWPCLAYRETLPPPCLCTHTEPSHITVPSGKILCLNVACGCGQYRPAVKR